MDSSALTIIYHCFTNILIFFLLTFDFYKRGLACGNHCNGNQVLSLLSAAVGLLTGNVYKFLFENLILGILSTRNIHVGIFVPFLSECIGVIKTVYHRGLPSLCRPRPTQCLGHHRDPTLAGTVPVVFSLPCIYLVNISLSLQKDRGLSAFKLYGKHISKSKNHPSIGL